MDPRVVLCSGWAVLIRKDYYLCFLKRSCRFLTTFLLVFLSSRLPVVSDCPAGQTARVTSNLHSSSGNMAVSRVPSPPLPEVNTPVAENWCYTQVSCRRRRYDILVGGGRKVSTLVREVSAKAFNTFTKSSSEESIPHGRGPATSISGPPAPPARWSWSPHAHANNNEQQ